MRTIASVLLRAALLAACGFSLLAGAARADHVRLISRVDPAATPPRPVGAVTYALISPDGRWVAFDGTIPDLVPGQNDGNIEEDVFLLDRTSGVTTLVSHAAGFPTQTGSDASFLAGLSDDGRYVAFTSDSTNLAAGQTRPGSSPGGNAFLWDRTTGVTTLVSHRFGAATIEGNGFSYAVRLSADGRYLSFSGTATDLIAGETGGNGDSDVFLWDRDTGVTTLVSHSAAGATISGNGGSFLWSASGDGRWLAFESPATDLVSGGTDDNGNDNVFLWDRDTGLTTLVSHAAGSASIAANGSSSFPRISRDGSAIAFASYATDLLAGFSGGDQNLFLWSRDTGTVALVSHAPGDPTAAQGGLVDDDYRSSNDGAFLVFSDTSGTLASGQTDGNEGSDVFLYERATGTNTLVSHGTTGTAVAGNGPSAQVRIAGDGSRVSFVSAATDLASGVTDGNGTDDLFQWSRAGGKATLVSHAAGAPDKAAGGTSQLAYLTADGGLLLFMSAATDLTSPADQDREDDLFIGDTATGVNTLLSASPAAVSTTPQGGIGSGVALSADGRFAVYSSSSPAVVPGQTDTNDTNDVFLVDRGGTGATTLVSHAAGSPATAANSASSDAVISADGRWVAFLSVATDLVPGYTGPEPNPDPGEAEIYLWDRLTGGIVLVSHSDESPTTGACLYVCEDISISADGRFVAYDNSTTSSVHLFDRDTGNNQVIPGFFSIFPTLSANGRYLAYTGSDDGNAYNLFLFDRVTAATALVSHASGTPGSPGDGSCYTGGAVSADGRYVAYECLSTDLAAGQTDTNGGPDVFLYDRVTGINTLVSHAAAASGAAGNGRSGAPFLSANGRWIAFSSTASDLVAGVTDSNGRSDAFLYDRVTGVTTLLSRQATAPTRTSTGESFARGISADGSTVAVVSDGTDLLSGITDRNGTADLFLVAPRTGAVTLASRSPADPSQTGNGPSFTALFSTDGRVTLFISEASDLAAGDHNNSEDLFTYVRAPEIPKGDGRGGLPLGRL